MGEYSDRIKSAHEAQHLTAEQIRANKCKRCKQRNAVRRQERREKAEARQAKWAALSTGQKIDRLVKRPGECKRQLSRIIKATP